MSKQWRSFAAVALWVLSASACDSLDTSAAGAAAAGKPGDAPAAEGAAKAAKTEKAEAPAKPAAAGPIPEAVDTKGIQKALGDYRMCVVGCMDDKHAKETDKETCKLTCRTNAEAAGVDPETAVVKIADRFDVCMEGCYDPKMKATDRETCKLNCETVAEVLGSTLDFANPGEGAHTDATPVGQGCARSCMTQMGSCERLCDEQEGKETDRETCRLLCTANGDICIDTCNIEAAKRGK